MSAHCRVTVTRKAKRAGGGGGIWDDERIRGKEAAHIRVSGGGGAVALSAQTQAGSQELRARLWWLFFNVLRENSTAFDFYDHGDVQVPMVALLYDWHVTRCYRPADDFTSSFDYWLEELKAIFMEGDYLKIFGLLQ
jgi:hypothetical protein